MRRSARTLVAASLAIAVASSARGQSAGIGRLSIERHLVALGRPDADERTSAARMLALIGPSERVVPELARTLTGEAVPAVRAALVTALARRGDESAVPVLIASWDRTTPPEREHLLDGLAAIGTAEALSFVADRLASELHRPGACARLERHGDAGVDVVLAGLTSPERRDAAVRCLTQLAARDRAASALVAIAPTLDPPLLAAALDALASDPRAVAIAVPALESTDPAVARSALEVLARTAPDRVPLERWRALAGGPDGRSSAIVALLALDRPSAEEAIARVLAESGARATDLLAALARVPSLPAAVLSPFVEVEATRLQALDHLVAIEGGLEVLAALPPAPDVRVALAIATASDPRGLDALRAQVASIDPSTRRALLSIAGALEAGECADGAALEDREGAAYCLYRARGGAAVATRALETEREPSVVAWLSLASEAAPSEAALLALLARDRTRVAMLHLVPSAMARASPPSRRRFDALLVHAARAPRPRERAEALHALGMLGDPDHRALIALALEDEAAAVRIAAARALSRLPSEPVSQIRRQGRARIEHDEDVRRALEGMALPEAAEPVHLRVNIAVEGDAAPEVEIALADGRTLVLTPVNGEIVLFGVPDAEARAHLLDSERD